MIEKIWLVPLFPLIGFLAVAFNFTRFKGNLSGIIASSAVFLSFIGSVILFMQLTAGQEAQTVDLFNWIHFNNLTIPFSFLVDRLSVLMMMIITGVGFLIHVYSIGYMKEDPGVNRFFAYMNLFIFFMLLLVLGSNYLVMFIGWEGVGLCSYLLIGFWFKNQEFNNAAKKAFIMNRIGDLGFLLALFMLIQQFGTLNFSEIFTKSQNIPSGDIVITTITLLLFVGAVGKSAQIPLFTWLPDAMAGPTPVSALIHAATMVTAGIYMIARSNVLFVLAPVTMWTISVIGIATSILAGSIAIFQNDIKKILAYSTISQLGLMFVALGAGSFTAAMFHLTTHAFFKALLFLAAGSVIHALSGEQDIRKMGGLQHKIPVTFWVFFIGSLAISGVPPFAGFFSKDMIMLATFQSSPVLWVVSVVVALMTSFYMFRLLFTVFWGKAAKVADPHHPVHESPKNMTIPMMVLAALSVFGGMIGIPELFGGSDRIQEYLSPIFAASASVLKQQPLETNSAIELGLMLIPLIMIFIVIYVAYFLYAKGRLIDQKDKPLSFFENLITRKFYIDELYELIIQQPISKLSLFFHDVIEIKGIDRLVNNTGNMIIWAGKNIRYIQTGNVGVYLFFMVVSIIMILFFNLFN